MLALLFLPLIAEELHDHSKVCCEASDLDSSNDVCSACTLLSAFSGEISIYHIEQLESISNNDVLLVQSHNQVSFQNSAQPRAPPEF